MVSGPLRKPHPLVILVHIPSRTVKEVKVSRWRDGKAPILTPCLSYLGTFMSLQRGLLSSEHVCELGWMVFENQSECDLKTSKPINIF